MMDEHVSYAAMAPKREPRVRRWWRMLGIPKYSDTAGDSEWYSNVIMDGALIANHAISGGESGELGRIETGIYLDRRTLTAALLRGHLDIQVQHNVWGARKPQRDDPAA